MKYVSDFEAKCSQQSGACTDLSLWPSNYKKVDFLGQSEHIRSPSPPPVPTVHFVPVKTFLGQSNGLDPSTTLFAIFFGIKYVINPYLVVLYSTCGPGPSDFGDSRGMFPYLNVLPLS